MCGSRGELSELVVTLQASNLTHLGKDRVDGLVLSLRDSGRCLRVGLGLKAEVRAALKHIVRTALTSVKSDVIV